ncbi:MAG TPA: hypothetical protein VG145_05985 [Xanthobacteraceae bacterium]|nr:hypothetical protein [Xanthobacteraceae bacterium]
MSSRTRMRPPLAATAAVAFLSVAGFASEASAHVKWFCAFDVAGQPRGLENVLCADFEGLVGLAVLVLILGCLVDGTALGDAVLRALDRVTGPIRANQDILVRAVGGFFFVTLWSMEGILLTPELKTTSTWIPWLQLAIAAGLIWRRTMPLSGLGIAALFVLAVRDYGVFHLADYPVFLGLAAYLVLVGLQRDLLGLRPLDVARYSAAVTLMWASIEKWAYPEWSFPLFIEHPAVTMGFDGEFFMRAAGVIEFTLAFALLWTPLVRRVSAIVLAAMFVAATFEFGKIDVIGHAPIVVVLVAIAGDDLALVQRTRRFAAAVPVAYSVALAGFLTAYYVAHTWLFGTQIL